MNEPAKAADSKEAWRVLAVWVLRIQSAAGLAWWVVMALRPELRSHFVPGAPEVLWALLVPDLLLFVGAGLLAAFLLSRRSSAAFPTLLVHVGGVVYSSLYTLSLCILSREAWLGALFMTPPLLVTPFLAWKVRP
jgi:hypothetical protein